MSNSIDKNLIERHPNFRVEGQLYLVKCPRCLQINYSIAVASGQCAWCYWKEEEEV